MWLAGLLWFCERVRVSRIVGFASAMIWNEMEDLVVFVAEKIALYKKMNVHQNFKI